MAEPSHSLRFIKLTSFVCFPPNSCATRPNQERAETNLFPYELSSSSQPVPFSTLPQK